MVEAKAPTPRTNWIALDAGGTMTDAVVVDASGNFLVGKYLTNKQDESVSFLGSIRDSLAAGRHDLRGTLCASEVVVYAGTIMLNTLLSRTGAKVGLMVTQGFEDYLLMEKGEGAWLAYPYADRLHTVTHQHSEPTIPRSRIVGVQERHAIRRQRLDELRLAHRDRVHTRRARVMHRYLGDASDDADARTHEPGEIRDLARHVEADLDHRHLVARLDAEEGQRDADLVVERRLASQHAITYAERGRGRLLRRRLPDVPGDADRWNRMGIAQRVGELAQRVLRIGDLHEHRAVGQIRDGPFHDGGAGAMRERVRHELVAVTSIAQSEEQAAGFGDSRVVRAADESLFRVRHAVDDPSTRRAKHLVEGEHVRANGTERQGRSGWMRA